jgi:hypothetical protein
MPRGSRGVEVSSNFMLKQRILPHCVPAKCHRLEVPIIGVAHDYGNNRKAGVLVKDVIAKNYTAVLSDIIQIKAQARLGLAYLESMVTMALGMGLINFQLHETSIHPGYYLPLGSKASTNYYVSSSR